MKIDRQARVLLIGWTSDEATSLKRSLEHTGISVDPRVVDSVASLKSALNLELDLVVYRPARATVSADEIAGMLRPSGRRTPVIVVGEEGELEAAIEALKSWPVERASHSRLAEVLRTTLGRAENTSGQSPSNGDPLASDWERGYRLAVEESGDAIYLVQDNRIQLANQRTAEYSGYSIEELISRPFTEFVHPEDQDQFGERYERVAAGTLPHNCTYIMRMSCRSSGYEWVSYNCASVPWRQRPAAIVYMRPAFSRGFNEYCQQLCEERFVQFMNRLPVLANIKDRTGRILFINAHGQNLVGRPTDELIGQRYAEASRLATQSVREVDAIESSVLESGVPFKGILEHVIDGQTRYFLTVKFPLLEKGSPGLIGTVLMEVTDQILAERALRESEKRYHDLFEHMMEPLTLLEPVRDDQGKVVDFLIVDSNPATEPAVGMPIAQYVGQRVGLMFPGFEKTAKFDLYVQVAQTGIAGRVLQKAFLTDALLETTVFSTSGGLIAAISEDVTLIRRAEEELHRAFAYTRGLIEASLDPLVTISESGKITDVNRATEDVTGYPRENLIGQDFCDYFTEPENAREGYQKVLRDGQVTDYPLTIKHVSGKTTDVLYNATVYADEDGHLQGVFAAARDITARKRAEEKIERLARVLSLMSGINEAIVRIHGVYILYGEVCRIAVDRGGLRMVWVGTVDDETGMVRVAASAGVVDGYLDDIQISARDEAIGWGPTGRCVREGRYSTCLDFQTDPRMGPWREAAAKRGYRCSAAFPLRCAGKVIGAFTLYSGELGFFDAEEIRLLLELADDISMALELMDQEKARIAAEEQLKIDRRMLEEKNIALREVLTQLESEKNAIRKRFTTNVEQAILPSLIRLSESTRGAQKRELELLVREVTEIVSPFIDKLRGRFTSLSPREVEICRMIKGGLSSKEIAESLNIAPKTVQKYRELIRKKLKLTNKDTNLRTFLESMPS